MSHRDVVTEDHHVEPVREGVGGIDRCYPSRRTDQRDRGPHAARGCGDRRRGRQPRRPKALSCRPSTQRLVQSSLGCRCGGIVISLDRHHHVVGRGAFGWREAHPRQQFQIELGRHRHERRAHVRTVGDLTADLHQADRVLVGALAYFDEPGHAAANEPWGRTRATPSMSPWPDDAPTPRSVASARATPVSVARARR